MFNRLKLWFVGFLTRILDKTQVVMLNIADKAGEELDAKFVEITTEAEEAANTAFKRIQEKINKEGA